jgi:phage-related minor tail protein
VQKVSDNVLSLQAKQNTVNEFTAKALESLTEKSDRHEQMLADHASTLRLMTDVLMRKKDQQS